VWRPALNLGFFAVTLAELAAPWAYLRRTLTIVWLLLVVPFHLLAPVIMHVLFAHNLWLIVTLYVWPLTWRTRGQALVASESSASPIDRSRCNARRRSDARRACLRAQHASCTLARRCAG
jgi:hypothetical protein